MPKLMFFGWFATPYKSFEAKIVRIKEISTISKYILNKYMRQAWIVGENIRISVLVIIGMLLLFQQVIAVDAHGLFSISFDDGYPNQTAVYYPLMNNLGLIGTIYETNSEITNYRTQDKMNISQLLNLQNKGWEIGSHTYNHELLNSSTANYTHILGDSYKEDANKGLYITTVAYPEGVYNYYGLSNVSNYFMGGRPVDGEVIVPNTLEDSRYLYDKYQLGTYHIGEDKAATTQSIKDQINYSISNNTWLSIYCHDTDCNRERVNFTDIMNYVQSKVALGDLKVVTIRDGIENYRNVTSVINTTNHSINFQTDVNDPHNPIYNNIFNFKQDAGKYRIDIIGRSVTNLVANPSFESGLANWTKVIKNTTNTIITTDTGNVTAIDGSHVLRINQKYNGTPNTNPDYAELHSSLIPVSNNTMYTLSAYIKTVNASCKIASNAGAYITYSEYYANRSIIPNSPEFITHVMNNGTTNFILHKITLGDWTPYFITSSSTTYISIIINFNYCKGDAYFDAVQLVTGARSPPFVNGTNPTTIDPILYVNGMKYAYTGTILNDGQTIRVNVPYLLMNNITGTAKGSGDFDYTIHAIRDLNCKYCWVNKYRNGTYYLEKIFFPPNASLEFWSDSTVQLRTNFNYTIRSTINGTIGNITLLPSSDSVNINISVWNTTGDYHKTWRESSTNHSVTTQHTIGDFPVNTSILIKKNGVAWNTYTSNSTGFIKFTYADGYSDIQFDASLLNVKSRALSGFALSPLISLLMFVSLIMGLIFIYLYIIRCRRYDHR